MDCRAQNGDKHWASRTWLCGRDCIIDAAGKLEGEKILEGVEDGDDADEELPLWEQARCLRDDFGN